MQKGKHGRTNRFGEIHVNIRHGEEIRNAGYKSEREFIEDVAENYTQIYEGDNGTYILVKKNGKTGVAFIEIKAEADYYTVNSAFPTSERYLKGKKLLWERGAPTTSIRHGQPESPLRTAPESKSAEVPPDRQGQGSIYDSTIGQEGKKVNTDKEEAAHMDAVIKKAEEMVAGESADSASNVLFEEDGRLFTMTARETLEETETEINLFKKIKDCLQ